MQEKEVEIQVEIGVVIDKCMTKSMRTLSDEREDRSRGLDPILGVSTNRDRIRCYRCREYDHFVEECPNIPTDEELNHSNVEQS